MNNRTTLICLFCAVTLASSCSLVHAAFARLHSDFTVLDTNVRVFYEPASRALALQVAHQLDNSIGDIERFFALQFQEPIEILVFSNRDRFANYCYTSTKPRAVTFGATICISPKINTEANTVPAILKHELSHVLLRQHLGFWKYEAGLPTWFREGIAVTASRGGGAETVSQDAARRAILTDHTFQPLDSGSLFFRKHASTYNLPPRMFYRQSHMFIEFLKEHDEAFNAFLVLLQREQFKTAFEQSFKKSVPAMWKIFVGQLRQSGHKDDVAPEQLKQLSGDAKIFT